MAPFMLSRKEFANLVEGGDTMNKGKLLDEVRSNFNLDDFYVINIWDDEITLQGDYTDRLDKEIIQKGFSKKDCGNWKSYKKKNIMINLIVE